MNKQKHPRLNDPVSTVADPTEQVPFGPEGARFLCNLLQHGVFLGGLMTLLIIIGYFGPPQ